jgi:hypothetical protein
VINRIAGEIDAAFEIPPINGKRSLQAHIKGQALTT